MSRNVQAISPDVLAETRNQMEANAQGEGQPVMVVVDVRGNRNDKFLTVVRQALALQNGQLVLVGPKREERVDTFEWIGR